VTRSSARTTWPGGGPALRFGDEGRADRSAVRRRRTSICEPCSGGEGNRPARRRPAGAPPGGGRLRPEPGGLRRVEEVVTSRSHQRIDRPLLPERSLSWTAGVRHTWPGWASSAMPLSATICGPDGCPAGSRTLAMCVDTGTTCRSRRGHGNWRGPASDPALRLTQATARLSKVSRVGVQSAWLSSGPRENRSGPAADAAGQFRFGRLPCRPGSGHRGQTAASGPSGGSGG
jgi:hypothetical protein